MLKDLTVRPESEIQEWFERCQEWEGFKDYDREDFDIMIGIHPENHLETGIYEFVDCNFSSAFTFEPTYEQEYQSLDVYNAQFRETHEWEKCIPEFGVADNLEQIKKLFEKPISDPNYNFVIWVHKIWQKNQSEEGDWRWHKWGPYIGDLKPECEYLYDEDFGKDWQGYVYIFHILKLD